MEVTDLPAFDAANYLDSATSITTYLTDILDANNAALLASALGDITRARGMTEIAKTAGITREVLYKAMRTGIAPRFDTVSRVCAPLSVSSPSLSILDRTQFEAIFGLSRQVGRAKSIWLLVRINPSSHCNISLYAIPNRVGQIYVLFECYLDDSKDQQQQFAYVCAGFVGARAAWKRFDRAWREQLKAEGIRYFKTSEYKSLQGEFARFRIIPKPFGRQAATLVRKRLLNVLDSSVGLRGVGVAVPVTVMKKVMQHAGATQALSPGLYDRAFEGCIYKAVGISTVRGDKVAFVHDEGDFAHQFNLYMSFKKVNPYTAKRLAGFVPMDDTTTPALQVADMLANDVMGRTVELLTTGVPTAKDVALYRRSQIFGWSREYGEAVLGANLERLGIPTPDSLSEAMDRLNQSGYVPDSTFRSNKPHL